MAEYHVFLIGGEPDTIEAFTNVLRENDPRCVPLAFESLEQAADHAKLGLAKATYVVILERSEISRDALIEKLQNDRSIMDLTDSGAPILAIKADWDVPSEYLARTFVEIINQNPRIREFINIATGEETGSGKRIADNTALLERRMKILEKHPYATSSHFRRGWMDLYDRETNSPDSRAKGNGGTGRA